MEHLVLFTPVDSAFQELHGDPSIAI